MNTRRQVIDYALQRRATLAALFHGGAFSSDVCDADPYLLRAAKHHGEATQEPCPVCRKEPLTLLTYVFGDELGPYSGRIKATRELELLGTQYGAIDVYVVEICQKCHWNHLRTQFVLGDGVVRTPPRRRSADA